MSTDEDYGPCYHCGTLTDSHVCSSDCARILDLEKRQSSGAHACMACDEPCDCDPLGVREDCRTCSDCEEQP